jgi:hypothetical protein
MPEVQEINKKITGIDCDYVNWLYGVVDGFNYPNYQNLMLCLNDIPFICVLERDDSRARDALNLRENFVDNYGFRYIPDQINYFYNEEYSVLEVLIALSIKCDSQVMGDIKKGNRTADWFWRMIKNLGLFRFTNETFGPITVNQINNIVNIFVYRRYNFDGKGGIFPLQNPPGDERKVELWYQMMSYLNENFPI